MVGEAGLEPAQPWGDGFTARCNCHYATRPYKAKLWPYAHNIRHIAHFINHFTDFWNVLVIERIVGFYCEVRKQTHNISLSFGTPAKISLRFFHLFENKADKHIPVLALYQLFDKLINFGHKRNTDSQAAQDRNDDIKPTYYQEISSYIYLRLIYVLMESSTTRWVPSPQAQQTQSGYGQSYWGTASCLSNVAIYLVWLSNTPLW